MLYEVPEYVMKEAFDVFEQIIELPSNQHLLAVNERAPNLETILAVMVLVAADSKADKNGLFDK